jgi:hypothetical protein
VVVLGVAIWLAWGAGALLAYAGALLVTVGGLVGWVQARQRRPPA